MPDPDWWNLAVELEQQDRLAEAEQVIKAALAPRGDPGIAKPRTCTSSAPGGFAPQERDRLRGKPPSAPSA